MHVRFDRCLTFCCEMGTSVLSGLMRGAGGRAETQRAPPETVDRERETHGPADAEQPRAPHPFLAPCPYHHTGSHPPTTHLAGRGVPARRGTTAEHRSLASTSKDAASKAHLAVRERGPATDHDALRSVKGRRDAVAVCPGAEAAVHLAAEDEHPGAGEAAVIDGRRPEGGGGGQAADRGELGRDVERVEQVAAPRRPSRAPHGEEEWSCCQQMICVGLLSAYASAQIPLPGFVCTNREDFWSVRRIVASKDGDSCNPRRARETAACP